ncbi:MAG: pyruvate ferredoxin oxidoreductase [Sulfurovum sp. PC08-66]|nr:MAG: pyruvate ferredoxin oxidoreductase [Sulfurovum sp. PC08-66]KIM12573.1 MAG: pyruvate ferredoxin oxidoreductase [Sulfuricurvum sp. PC08-66]
MNKGWNEFDAGAILFTFNEKVGNISEIHSEDRPYSPSSSFTASVSDWRIEKPVFNKEYCIDCQFCWIYCPDVSIISRDKKMVGVDYDHCKGCGICVEVCPTNPKSLMMVAEGKDEEEVLAAWPQKDQEKNNG